MKCTLPNILLLLLLFAQLAVAGQFTDIAGDLGLDIIHEDTEYGNGMSFYDFNHDGWDDLTVANGDSTIQFYVNNEGIPEPANFSLDYDPVGHVVMILWGDIENDGDSDLLTTELEGEMHLWRNNGDFTFEDITEEAGLISGSWRFRGAAFGDYDHDGFLDLYVSKYYTILNNNEEQYKSKLFHNNGNATFTDVTVQAGVDLATSPNFQPVFMDYNHDGWEDLYLVIDRNFFMNRLFRNNHDGTFTDVSVASGANPSIDAMSGTIGDFDNDTDLDIFVANGWPGNHLYQNNGDDTFSNIASAAGVMVQMICWGSLWLDYDNDCWRDLYVGTTGNFFGAAQSRFFINNRNDTFSPGETVTGIQDSIAAVMVCAMGDLNHDGYYDFMTHSNDPHRSELWLNDGGDNHYISVRLEGVQSNRDGVGAWIHCYAGGQHFVDYTRAGDSFNSQSSSSYIFGLDSLTIVDSLLIEWNSGITDVFYNVPVDQRLHITEGLSSEMQTLTLFPDTIFICPGESLELNAGAYETYAWNTGDTTQSIVVNAPGEYFVVVPGLFSIVTESEHVHVLVHEAVDFEFEVSHVSCYGAQDGSIWLSGNGAAQIYWPQTGQYNIDLDNLSPGIYEYQLLDSNNCAVNGTVTVSEPPAIQWYAESMPASCATPPNGWLEIELEGQEIAFLNWDDGATGTQRTGLSAGDYHFSGADANGCPFEGSVSITAPDSILVTVALTPPLCAGENSATAELSVAGGTGPVSANWNGQNPDSLYAGTYTVVITDSVGCSVTTEFEIPETLPLMLEIQTSPQYENGMSGNAFISVSGGTPPYFYEPAGDGNGHFLSLNAGMYEVTVSDAAGCEALANFEIALVQGIDEWAAGAGVILFFQSENNLCANRSLADVEVFNLTGQRVMGLDACTCIETTMLPAGCYVLTGFDDLGNRVRKKFIK
jgi:hypothetical protein